MIVSVASGKGGTGKTTVATNLASVMGDAVALLDCDVEEPNAHLFLAPEIEEEKEVGVFVPEVDQEKCIGCRACVTICRFSAIAAAGKKILVFPELCHSCEGCLEVCPEQAISAGTRELGKLVSGKAGQVLFHGGRMRIGEAMAPPLIRAVRTKEEARPDTIIDAPPGTSCPVITAMRGTDFVLLVTEPTPFGLHDLKLAVGAVQTLGIPAGLVINRAGLGNDMVRDYAAQEGLSILLEIPFDQDIARAYSRGQLLVEALPGWRQSFIDLFARIKSEVEGRAAG